MSRKPLSNNIVLPQLHQGQRTVLEQQRRFNFLAAGRRWRKSTLMMSLAVTNTVNTKKSVVWGAPTYDQVRIGWSELKRSVANVYEFNHTHMIATSPARGTIIFRSLDNPDNARGHTADLIILDEASDINDEAYYSVLLPMIIDTGGGIWCIGTPKGAAGFFYDEFMKAETGQYDDYASWRIPTVGAVIDDGKLYYRQHPLENPEIPFSELEKIFYTMSERTFRQEILAEFLSDAGGVFSNVRRCISGSLQSGPTHKSDQYVIGVDLAKYRDFTCCIVMDKRSGHLVDFQRFNKIDWPDQKMRIYNLHKKWNDAQIHMDSTGIGSPILDDFHRAQIPALGYHITPASKKELIEKAVIAVEDQRVTFPHIEILIQELEAFEYHQTAHGNLQMMAPRGLHDDTVIAFALCVWLLSSSVSTLHSSSADLLIDAFTRKDDSRFRRDLFDYQF